MNAVLSVLSIVIAYLLGSIPFAYIIGKWRGLDIRKVGDKNVGTFNVFRHGGWMAGILTLVADVGKGALAIIVAKLLSNLFDARKAGTVPAGMVVVEEAHNFCPEKGFMKTTSSDVLRAIASEGRKFGLGLLIISQRPAKVDKNVLSQCNTQIIMRVTNPNDIRAIAKSLEGISSELEEEIKRLPPGIALFVNPDIPRAVMVQVRVRKSKHGGASKEISEDIEPDGVEEEGPAPVESGTPGESIFKKLFGRR